MPLSMMQAGQVAGRKLAEMRKKRSITKDSVDAVTGAQKPIRDIRSSAFRKAKSEKNTRDNKARRKAFKKESRKPSSAEVKKFKSLFFVK